MIDGNLKSVLFVGSYLSARTGTSGVAEGLARDLRELGWQTRLTSTVGPRPLRLLDMIGTTLLGLPSYSIAAIDVYSGAAFRYAEIVSTLMMRLGKPYVLALRGGNLPLMAVREFSRLRTLLHSAPAVVTPSRYIQHELGQLREDIRLLPNGVDFDRYPFRPRDRPAPRLVWLRAFLDIYNPTLAPRVVARLVDRFPDVKLIMIGPDKGDGSRQRTEYLARELGVADRIEFTGPVRKVDVPTALGRGDILLNTTRAESFGVAVMEAAALGLCIVSTSVGELPYLWSDPDEVLLVPDDDDQSMAEAVERILTEEATASRLSWGASRKARQYGWKRTVRLWDDALTDIL